MFLARQKDRLSEAMVIAAPSDVSASPDDMTDNRDTPADCAVTPADRARKGAIRAFSPKAHLWSSESLRDTLGNCRLPSGGANHQCPQAD
jgi:hypothetical protein